MAQKSIWQDRIPIRQGKEQPHRNRKEENTYDRTRQSKGFEITLHDAQRIVRIRAWGCWDVELAKKYGGALGEKIGEICRNGKEWCALVDLTAFFSRSKDAQRMMREPFATASKRGLKKVAYLGTKSATQLRLNKRFRETEMPMHACFESQDEALQWLLSE